MKNRRVTFYRSFLRNKSMSTLKSILRSKKFWTFVSSLVAALSAYFLVACSTTYRTAQTFLRYEGPDSSRYTLIFDQTGSVKKSNSK